MNENKDEVKRNVSDMSVSFFVIVDHKIALSELSVFPTELAKEFIIESKLNDKQKEYMLEILKKSEKIYFYSRLNVPPKLTQKGLGTKLLQETLKFISETNGFLLNTANAYGEKDQESLIRFYQKNGMVLIQKDGLLVYNKDIDNDYLLSLKDKSNKPKF